MATVPANDVAVPNLPDEVNRPPTGIVLPPKDIRAIVEKTAGYVARNGAVFEERIREKEKTNAKFSFLSTNDAYNPFYTWRLKEVREGRGTAVSAGRAQEEVTAEAAKPRGPAAPPEFHFSARMPNISAQDLEVVRLTALFAAKNGRSFMTTLSQREARNYQFDFLRPQHSLHQFFSRLVDQYTDLLRAATVDSGQLHRARLVELDANIANRFHILQRSKQRSEWVKFQEQQKQAKEEEEEKEQMAFAQIDWHDFVVVETVLFSEQDEQTELPPPTSLNDLQSASLEQKAAMSLQPHNRRIEEAMPSDDMIDYALPPQHPQNNFASHTANGYGQPPPSFPSQFHASASMPTYMQENDEENETIAQRTAERERAQAVQAAAKGAAGQPMRIRSDYVPRAQARRQNVAVSLCPNCKQQIPNDELSEHMRIELLDPQWKEQREKAHARQASSHVSIIDASANLKRLASNRQDGAPEAAEDAKRTKLPPGHGLDIPEQFRQIRQKFN